VPEYLSPGVYVQEIGARRDTDCWCRHQRENVYLQRSPHQPERRFYAQNKKPIDLKNRLWVHMKNQRRFAPTKTGRLASEQVAAFRRNHRPKSSESALFTVVGVGGLA
jgi:hypothetical protein